MVLFKLTKKLSMAFSYAWLVLVKFFQQDESNTKSEKHDWSEIWQTALSAFFVYSLKHVHNKTNNIT